MKVETIWRQWWAEVFNYPAVNCKYQRRICRSALILLAVLSLTVSVATRYCALVRYDAHAPQFATSHSPEAKRQHLLNDGLHWSAPAVAFVLLEPPRAFSGALPAIPSITRPCSDNVHCTRPPPFC
jgi:hypothetical protein